MPYCIDCGIKVKDLYINCPLCHRAIEFPQKRKTTYPDYPEDTGKITFFKSRRKGKKQTLINLFGFVLLIITSITMGINYISAGNITWSWFTTSTFIYLYFSVLSLFKLLYTPYINYTVLNILLAFYLFILDFLTQANDWFLTYALECFIYLQFISLVCFILFKIVKSWLNKISIIVLLLSIFLNLIDFNINNKIGWSTISSSICLPVTLYLIILKLNLPKQPAPN